MSVHIPKRTSAATRWALRVGIFAVQILLVVALLHRFAGFPTPAFINALVLVFGLAVLTLVLAFWGFGSIWRDGIDGTTRGVISVCIALAILAWPAVYLPTMFRLPTINDVTTDPQNPPRYQAAAQARSVLANRATYPGPAFALMQQRAYPGLETIRVVRPQAESFEITNDFIKSQGWDVLRAVAPANGRGVGIIEAVDRTLVLGFADDVVIRIAGRGRVSEVDIRSSSRYDQHDFGRNAGRVADLLKQLEVRLDTGIPLEEVSGPVAAVGLPLPEPNPGRRNGRPSPAALLAAQRQALSAARGGRRARAGQRERAPRRFQDILSQ